MKDTDHEALRYGVKFMVSAAGKPLDVDPNNYKTVHPVGWSVTFHRNILSPSLVSLLYVVYVQEFGSVILSKINQDLVCNNGMN